MIRESQSFKTIAVIVKENPKAVSIICLCLVLANLFEAVGISAVFPLIAIILDTNSSLPDSKLTDFINFLTGFGPYFLALFVVGCFVLKSLVLNVVFLIIAKNISEFSHKLRISFVQAMLGANVGFILSKSLGENLSVLTNDSIRAAAAYVSATRVLSGFFQALVYFLYALWLSAQATVLSILTMVALIFFIRQTISRTREAGRKTTTYIHEISRNMGEALRGVKEAKATAREDSLNELIVKDSIELREAHATNIVVGHRLRNIQDPLTIASALLCLFIFKDVLAMESGYILFILAVYYRLMGSLNTLTSDYQKFIGQEAALWSIKDGTESALAEKENLREGGVLPQEQPEKISFKDVSMRYGDKDVFSKISFNVPAKKLTVFRGESGRGKTTCVDMICGLVTPIEGEVKVGSVGLSELDVRLWRKKIGYVDQFPFLFKGSVRDNIVMDSEGISDERIYECLRLCHADKFIATTPDGLDFELHEGASNLSGGQRQRLAIARAIISDPSYLILDEPTSALDRESSEGIFKTLAELSKTMSIIVISHSSIADKCAQKVIDFDSF